LTAGKQEHNRNVDESERARDAKEQLHLWAIHPLDREDASVYAAAARSSCLSTLNSLNPQLARLPHLAVSFFEFAVKFSSLAVSLSKAAVRSKSQPGALERLP
jgi:hypothetical protein